MAQQPGASWLHINAYGLPLNAQELNDSDGLVTTDIYAVLMDSIFMGVDTEGNFVSGQFIPGVGIEFFSFSTEGYSPLGYLGSTIKQGGSSSNTHYGYITDYGTRNPTASYIVVIEAESPRALPKAPNILMQEIGNAQKYIETHAHTSQPDAYNHTIYVASLDTETAIPRIQRFHNSSQVNPNMKTFKELEDLQHGNY